MININAIINTLVKCLTIVVYPWTVKALEEFVEYHGWVNGMESASIRRLKEKTTEWYFDGRPEPRVADVIVDDDDGYDVTCDGCDMLFGWVATREELPKELLLCKTCGPECCTTETLLRTEDPQYWSIIGHREEAQRMSDAIYNRKSSWAAWAEYGVDDDIPF